MPGRTPRDISRSISTFCETNDTILSVDFSKFDGTVTRDIRRAIEIPLLQVLFPSDKYRISEVIESEMSAKGITTYRIRYALDGGRASGSALTTVGNTPIAAFAAYVGLRIPRPDGTPGYSPAEAFALLGPAYGDDLLTRGDCLIQRAASLLGMVVKVNIVRLGEPLDYLGRIFPNPWASCTSHQDIVRTLKKIHLSCSPGQHSEDILLRSRATGYNATDSGTPLLGDLCRKYLELTENVDIEGVSRDMDYKILENINGSWPQPPEDYQLLHRSVCSALNISSIELDIAIDTVRNASVLEETRHVIFLPPNEAVDNVIVNDVLYYKI